MGAHTLLRFALEYPERAAALVVITPAYDPVDNDDPERLARWDALADGLRSGGVEGFVEAYGDPGVPEAWRETVLKVLRQRLSAHEHPEAVADALQRGAALAAVRHAARPGGDRGADGDRGRPRRGRSRAPAERGGGLRARHPGRAAGGGGAGPLADRVAGRPAVEGHRGGRRGGGAARPRPLGLSRPGYRPPSRARALAPASSSSLSCPPSRSSCRWCRRRTTRRRRRRGPRPWWRRPCSRRP